MQDKLNILKKLPGNPKTVLATAVKLQGDMPRQKLTPIWGALERVILGMQNAWGGIRHQHVWFMARDIHQKIVNDLASLEKKIGLQAKERYQTLKF